MLRGTCFKSSRSIPGGSRSGSALQTTLRTPVPAPAAIPSGGRCHRPRLGDLTPPSHGHGPGSQGRTPARPSPPPQASGRHTGVRLPACFQYPLVPASLPASRPPRPVPFEAK